MYRPTTSMSDGRLQVRCGREKEKIGKGISQPAPEVLPWEEIPGQAKRNEVPNAYSGGGVYDDSVSKRPSGFHCRFSRSLVHFESPPPSVEAMRTTDLVLVLMTNIPHVLLISPRFGLR